MTDYRFQQFDIRIMLDDIRFSQVGKNPLLLDYSQTVEVLDKGTVSLEALAAGRFLLVVTGSFSCPMTVSSLPELNALVGRYAQQFSPVLAYVREAHPGEHCPQADTLDEKRELARRLREELTLDWPIVIDSLEGALHQRLDIKPNSLHVFDTQGKCRFQALWGGDFKAIDQALKQLSQGQSLKKPVREAMFWPFLRGAGFILPVLRKAGAKARRELLIGAPPIWLLAWLADRFRFVPLTWRGFAAAGSMVLVVLMVI
ncbi:MAG: hypothetical protein RQ715_11210 [Methylococcales bacterium]|nr:hypothetical protein [Methylococcales bacterium]